MSSLAILAVLLAAGIIAFFIGRMQAVSVCDGDASRLHSRPPYHGSYLAIWTVLPAVLLLAIWSSAERPVMRHLVLQDMPETLQQASDAEISLTMSVVDSILPTI